jgi:hypothetical protein
MTMRRVTGTVGVLSSVVLLGLSLLSGGDGPASGDRAQGKQPAQSATQGKAPKALQAEIEALKAAKVAWRDIAWQSCLLEGLKESRAKKKPALLWVFIDRPVDDARC